MNPILSPLSPRFKLSMISGMAVFCASDPFQYLSHECVALPNIREGFIVTSFKYSKNLFTYPKRTEEARERFFFVGFAIPG